MSTPYGVALVAVLRIQGAAAARGDLPPALDRRVREIVAAAVAEGVDPAEVLALCVRESGVRLRNRRASLCGCQPYLTDDRTQARCAAAAWRRALDHCGSAERAVNRYVRGPCEAPRRPTPGPVEWRSHLARYRASWSSIVADLRASP